MAALLYILLATAWLEDGLLRRVADPQLSRRPLFGAAAWLLAGAMLAATIAAAQVTDLPPMWQSWLDALSLVLVGACLAHADRETLLTLGPDVADRVREWTPMVTGALVTIPLAAAWSQVPAHSWMVARDLRVVAALALLLTVVQWLAPALQGRIALAAFAPTRGAVASIATATILALALASAGSALR